MKIHMFLHMDDSVWPGTSAWFMHRPVEGPAYVATCRCTEAVRMVAFENHVWSRGDDGSMKVYKSMPPQGGFEE